MSNWQEVLRNSVTTVEELIDRFGAEAIGDPSRIQKAIDGFNLRITPAALKFIETQGDAFWTQYVPTEAELDVHDGIVDSLDEDADSPVPNITHRYPDRVLFLVSPVCATYCRFCTRRRKVGDPEKIPLNQYDSAFEYIRDHPEVRDVILSGGDPFMLSDRRIEYLLTNLRAIPHVEIIRIHTRMPSHLPERITPELCAIVKRHHPVYVNVHFNHPDEMTPEAEDALAMLADAGIPLGSQTVLLKGVNDEPEIMKRLMQLLVKNRVRPYYIYQADVVAGGEHFRTQFTKGLEIIRAIRGWTSGLCQPHFVIDAPGGGGKIPILPEYVESVTDEEVVLRNYAGEVFRYPLPRQPAQLVNRLVALENAKSARNGKANGNGNGKANGNGNGNGKADGNGKGKGNGKGNTRAAKSAAATRVAKAGGRKKIDVVSIDSLQGIVPMDV